MLTWPLRPGNFLGSGVCAHGASLPLWGTEQASREEGGVGVSSPRKKNPARWRGQDFKVGVTL